jgi:hypothetical protein
LITWIAAGEVPRKEAGRRCWFSASTSIFVAPPAVCVPDLSGDTAVPSASRLSSSQLSHVAGIRLRTDIHRRTFMSAVTSARPQPLHFAAFVMNTTGHIIQGTWRRPTARQADFNDLEHWVGLVRTLERARFDAIFFADVVGLYAPYRDDERKYFEAGLPVPSNDPLVLGSALAYVTEHLGIAFTASILQEHPFNFARAARSASFPIF